MTKTKKTVLIVVVSVLVLALGSAVAYAATNISELEELYAAFRTAQTQQAVENGDMTQEEADEYIDNMTEAMEEDETDAVPPLQGKGNMGERGAMGGKGGMMGGLHSSPVSTYAEMTGVDADELHDTLDAEETTIYAYADAQGDLDELKAALIEESNASIDQAVEDGKIDEDKADEMKASMEERINAITADTETPMGPNGEKPDFADGERPEGGKPMGGRGSMDCDEDCTASEEA